MKPAVSRNRYGPGTADRRGSTAGQSQERCHEAALTSGRVLPGCFVVRCRPGATARSVAKSRVVSLLSRRGLFPDLRRFAS